MSSRRTMDEAIAPAVDEALGVAEPGLEVLGAGERRHHRPARGGVVEIDDRQAHVPHVHRHRITEDQALDPLAFVAWTRK